MLDVDFHLRDRTTRRARSGRPAGNWLAASPIGTQPRFHAGEDCEVIEALESRIGAPLALRFSHSDRTPYGGKAVPLLAEIQAKAFRALRSMGFGEAEVRKGLRQGAPDSDQCQSLESVLRGALLELTYRHATKAA